LKNRFEEAEGIFLDNGKLFWLLLGSYDHIITDLPRLVISLNKKESRPNSLNDKILNAIPIAKSPSMVDENLHGYYLQFLTSKVDHLLILITFFSSYDQRQNKYVPLYNI
jgi:hypothetical protein